MSKASAKFALVSIAWVGLCASGCSSDRDGIASNTTGGGGAQHVGGGGGWAGTTPSGGSGGNPVAGGGTTSSLPVPPFGCDLGLDADPNCTGPSDPCAAPVGSWPGEEAAPSNAPLAYDKWMGPYMNPPGEAAVTKIDAWYAERSSSGLFQETFRSFDNDHSSIRAEFFPQLHVGSPTSGYQSDVCAQVLGQRVSSGVMSFGADFFGVKAAIVDAGLWDGLHEYYANGVVPPEASRPKWFRVLYEHNAFFVHPGAYSYENGTIDRFNYLSPFYFHSIGMSGTDAMLLKPILFASAAIAPALKTRILRAGMLVPTLMQLFRSTYHDIDSTEAHVPAFTLPPEADPGAASAPLLEKLIERAHDLTHIPPVARLRVTAAKGGVPALFDETPYAIFANVRSTAGEDELRLTLDLSQGWTDGETAIASFDARILRGPGNLEFLDERHSLVRITVPFTAHDFSDRSVLRTDVVFIVNDGTYDSAPAYLSVRHVQDGELG